MMLPREFRAAIDEAGKVGSVMMQAATMAQVTADDDARGRLLVAHRLLGEAFLARIEEAAACVEDELKRRERGREAAA